MNFIASLSSADSQASTDLAIAMDIIEKLKSENSALSHEVKNLLLRSFGIRSAACNVINNSKRYGSTTGQTRVKYDVSGRRVITKGGG